MEKKWTHSINFNHSFNHSFYSSHIIGCYTKPCQFTFKFWLPNSYYWVQSLEHSLIFYSTGSMWAWKEYWIYLEKKKESEKIDVWKDFVNMRRANKFMIVYSKFHNKKGPYIMFLNPPLPRAGYGPGKYVLKRMVVCQWNIMPTVMWSEYSKTCARDRNDDYDICR